MEGSEDLPFCATTYDMDADNRWGFCKFQGNERITKIVRKFLNIAVFSHQGVVSVKLITYFLLVSSAKSEQCLLNERSSIIFRLYSAILVDFVVVSIRCFIFLECRFSRIGLTYVGNFQTTHTNNKCQKWSSQYKVTEF